MHPWVKSAIYVKNNNIEKQRKLLQNINIKFYFPVFVLCYIKRVYNSNSTNKMSLYLLRTTLYYIINHVLNDYIMQMFLLTW